MQGMPNQRLKRALGLALAALLVVGLGGTLTQAAPQTGNVLRIGYLGPEGSQTANGAQLAIQQINAIGGVRAPDGTAYTLELLTLDTAPTADTLIAGIEQLDAQNVAALLGPDETAAFNTNNIEALVQTGLPVLTSATGDSLTELDAADVILRLRAPERVYSYALATVLSEDLGLSRIATVQADVASTEAALAFEAVLDGAGISLLERINLPAGSDPTDAVQRLAGADPEAIAMWGPQADAAELLRRLRDAGWRGTFAYRHADEAARAGILSDSLANGVLGVNSWSYGYSGATTRVFTREYVVAFGEVPGPLAVAAYDGVWFLRAAINAGGITPAGLRAALASAAPMTLVQGTLHPIEFETGDLARLAMVYELGLRGGPTVIAYFDDTTRLPLAGTPQAEEPGEEPGAEPTEPAGTVFPTPTLEGTWVRVTANVLNVRNGPGFNYAQIGQVSLNDQLRILGAIADYSWLAVDFQGGVGWVKTEFTEVLGDLGGVPILQAPPTPTPAATPTLTLAPNPDIVIDTVVLSPTNPIPNQPFTATVTVRNAGGGAAGRFAVAATFEPGGVYASIHVEGLAGGQTGQALLQATITGTGVHQVGIVADLNKEVAELNEDNNIYNVTYRADYPLFANQSGIQLTAGTQWDLYGGTVDLEWDGFNLAMLNGARIGILAGQTYENVHYDMLTPAVVNNSTGYGTGQVLSGAVYGFYIAEGRRAVLRVDNRQDQTIWISYRVYNNTP